MDFFVVLSVLAKLLFVFVIFFFVGVVNQGEWMQCPLAYELRCRKPLCNLMSHIEEAHGFDFPNELVVVLFETIGGSIALKPNIWWPQIAIIISDSELVLIYETVGLHQRCRIALEI